MNRVTLPPNAEVSLSVRSEHVSNLERHQVKGQPPTLTMTLTGCMVSRMDLHHAGDPDAKMRVTFPEDELVEHLRSLGYCVVKQSDSDLISGRELAATALGVVGPGPLRLQLQADEAEQDAVVGEIFGTGSVFDRDLGDETPSDLDLLTNEERDALPARLRFLFEPLDLSGVDLKSPSMQKALAAAQRCESHILELLSTGASQAPDSGDEDGDD